MFVVTVEFKVAPDRIAAFMPLMIENATLSRTREPGCRQFDVCDDPKRAGVIFLYELYDDRAAFDAHLATEHYKRFDAAVASMLLGKIVGIWERRSPE